MLRDIEMMNLILEKLNTQEGFQLASEDKKKHQKIYIKKEKDQNAVTMKIVIDYIKVPIYNVLTLIHEIELYPEWFPFC